MELSKEAQKVVNEYMSLTIGTGTNTPYFNNKRGRVRFGLRALVGKGTPQDLENEARILALRAHRKLDKLSSQDLKKFLVDSGLGIDCSGFAYHVLDAESRARGNGSLSRHIYVKGNLTRRLVSKIRPAENIGVGTLSLAENSSPIKIENTSPGDMITIIGTGNEQTYNHVLLVTNITKENSEIYITYAHSYAWPSDGKYGHGVRFGNIKISSQTNDLLKAEWSENNVTGEHNHTLTSALSAKEVTIRRLKSFS